MQQPKYDNPKILSTNDACLPEIKQMPGGPGVCLFESLFLFTVVLTLFQDML